MDDTQPDRRESGFKERTRVDRARDRLREAVPSVGSETVPLADADGRVLASTVAADRNVPHYRRAAMDGYAVRAADTFGASDRSPEVLLTSEGGDEAGGPGSGREVGPSEAARVHTGSEVPPGADAVVMVEDVERVRDEIEVFDAVAAGENVAPVGEDVEADQTLYEPGYRLRPSDLGLLKSVGVTEVEVVERPQVAVIPTGEELVQADPDPGEVIETNGLTVSRLVRRWGGEATYREVVTDDADALRDAIERDLAHDVVVTTGGSSVGERDLLPEVLADLGEVLVHGVALKPGHPVALAVVGETPVLALPGYPVACIVNAVQFLRPTLSWLAGTGPPTHPTVRATLARKIHSDPGTRTFARVKLDREGEEWTATPTRASGSGVLSSVALADGWVVVPESLEGLSDGEPVEVQDWEPSA
ncbi:molybdopterin molybdenumtransferase MoeA [Halobacteriales archaeon QS_1_68_20]|nr:MAG: molybdopterin molybdenumtransferase MoeA [Halobacteriales archaeon QS_1_68_20]